MRPDFSRVAGKRAFPASLPLPLINSNVNLNAIPRFSANRSILPLVCLRRCVVQLIPAMCFGHLRPGTTTVWTKNWALGLSNQVPQSLPRVYYTVAADKSFNQNLSNWRNPPTTRTYQLTCQTPQKTGEPLVSIQFSRCDSTTFIR